MIDADSARLIAATRLEGADLAALAAEVGTAYDTLKRRRWRAERRLRHWLDPRSCR